MRICLSSNRDVFPFRVRLEYSSRKFGQGRKEREGLENPLVFASQNPRKIDTLPSPIGALETCNFLIVCTKFGGDTDRRFKNWSRYSIPAL